jgi:hypothetical protein
MGSAKVFGAGQLVAGVVDHLIGFQLRRRVWTELVDLARYHDDHKKQKQLQQDRGDHSAVRENADGSFSSQARARARKGRANRGDEILPAWRPLDQQLGSVVKLDDPNFLDLESVGQISSGLRSLAMALHATPRSLTSLGMTSCRWVAVGGTTPSC